MNKMNVKTSENIFYHALLSVWVLVSVSVCDCTICSLRHGLKLSKHAVWLTKTGWLSSNSLQRDSPANGCRAKTERYGTELETVWYPWESNFLLFCRLQLHLACQDSSKRQSCFFTAVQGGSGLTKTAAQQEITAAIFRLLPLIGKPLYFAGFCPFKENVF